LKTADTRENNGAEENGIQRGGKGVEWKKDGRPASFQKEGDGLKVGRNAGKGHACVLNRRHEKEMKRQSREPKSLRETH